MTAAAKSADREVVPRWRQFGTTVRSGETAPLQEGPLPALVYDLAEPTEAFEQSPGVHTAAVLVGAALSSGSVTPAAVRAARYVGARGDAPPDATELAVALLGLADGVSLGRPDDEVPQLDHEAVKARAHELRRIVRAEPRNAVRWADLALAHTVLGHPDQAEREIRTALALAGPNRFLLRAAARLYVHLDRPEAAHDLLVRDPAVLEDPWLAAAELATAELAGINSRFARRARALVTGDAAFAPVHLAELASQVATAELRAGRDRHARRLMEIALRDPTDNALAQAEWASNHGLNLDPASLDRPRSYEARALRYANDRNWGEAAAAGMDWLADQPFAQEPAHFTSYTASVGAENWKLAETAARAGLIANPDDALLRNNLAFALANQDCADEAALQHSHVQSSLLPARDAAIHRATHGLILFRQGDAVAGRREYDTAIAELRRSHQPDLAALATVFWAREELRLGTDVGGVLLAAAKDGIAASSAPEADVWVERLERAAEEGNAARSRR